MVKVLVVLGQGGHTTEMLRLLDMIGNHYEYAYLISYSDPLSHLHIQFPGDIYYAIMPMRKWHHQRNYLPIGRILLSILQQLIIVLRVRPNVVFSTGPGIAIPSAVWGRLFGAKIIHIETAARMIRLSTSGRIMYKLAHLFFVQWESMLDQYPKAIYAGRLL
jgi:beta-1,4-N-acetylglucosaminyltransferase